MADCETVRSLAGLTSLTHLLIWLQYVPPEKTMMAAPRAWGGFDGYRLMPLEEAAAAEEEKVRHACSRSAACSGVLTPPCACTIIRRAAELQSHWLSSRHHPACPRYRQSPTSGSCTCLDTEQRERPCAEEGRVPGLPANPGAATGGAAYIGARRHRLPGNAYRWDCGHALQRCQLTDAYRLWQRVMSRLGIEILQRHST